jgi:hypothetical protein
MCAKFAFTQMLVGGWEPHAPFRLCAVCSFWKGVVPMTDVGKENVKTGQQETMEPWKPPVDSDHQPNKGDPPPRPRRAEDNETA